MSTEWGWQTQHVATSVHHFETTPSTQMEARRSIAAGEAHGALVVADEQTHGRGRFGRVWSSPRGNLYLSFVLRPSLPVADWSQLTMMAALALADAIEAVTALRPELKWPNDLLVGGRKVAGMLAEVENEYIILGVGVNVNAELPEELTAATSLRHAAGQPIDRRQLLAAFVNQFDAEYETALQGGQVVARWASRLRTLGQRLRVRMGAAVIAGVAESVEADGALVVMGDDGRRVVCHAGEVTLSV